VEDVVQAVYRIVSKSLRAWGAKLGFGGNDNFRQYNKSEAFYRAPNTTPLRPSQGLQPTERLSRSPCIFHPSCAADVPFFHTTIHVSKYTFSAHFFFILLEIYIGFTTEKHDFFAAGLIRELRFSSQGGGEGIREVGARR
jgi:hypothetical protein